MVAALSSSVATPALHRRPVGGAASSVWAGVVEDLDENARTRGPAWYGEPGVLGESQKMLTDAHVRSARDVVVDPVVAAEWDFEPGGARPIDIEAALYNRYVFFEAFPWKRALGSVMRGYWRDGFALREVTVDTRRISRERFPLHPGRGAGIVLTGLHDRPAWSVWRWHQNPSDPTQIAGITQQLRGADEESAGFVSIPGEWLLRWTWEQEGADYEGFAPQRSAYGPWFVKRLLTRVEAMGHEKNHLAQPIAQHSEENVGSEDEDKKVLKILSEFRAHEKGAHVLPFGYVLQWSQHGQQTNIAETITRCNFDIAHNSGAGFTLLGQAEGPGSYALAGTQKGQFDLGLEKHGDFNCSILNHGLDGWSLVERITRLNYGPDVAVPQAVVRYMPTVDFIKTLPILKQLADANIIKRDRKLEMFARRGLKAPNPDPATANEYPAPTAGPKSEVTQ